LEARQERQMTYKRILVPVDGSPTAEKGLLEAIDLATLSQARLLLLHVVDEYPAFASNAPAAALGAMMEMLRETGRRTLERISAHARELGAAPETLLVENFGGRVSDVIAEQAVKCKADLIVMGTHGRRGMSRALLGSDAESVVRYSPVPVLLVPPNGRGAPVQQA
jgi:nucleotide-binding universal stress UspA family protein